MLIGLNGAVQAQNFAAPVQNPFFMMPVVDLAIPKLVDMDGDGDLDLFVAEYGEYEATLIYYNNEGTATNPIFGKPRKNPFNFTTSAYRYIFPSFADVDNDGDIDMLGMGITGYGQLDFLYHENVGTATAPNFATEQINPFGLLPNAPITVSTDLADMDNDGDFDMLTGGINPVGYLGTISYFENTGTNTQPAFAGIQENPFGLGNTYAYAFPATADLDGDGDLDILSGEYYGGLQYFENTGTNALATFAPVQANPFGLVSVNYLSFPTFGDIDGDGDLDLFVGEADGNVQFFENLEIEVAIQDPEKESVMQIFPNPASEQITIQQTNQLLGESHISIVNELGVTVRQMKLTKQEQTINIKDLPVGFYMVELKTESEQMARKLVIK